MTEATAKGGWDQDTIQEIINGKDGEGDLAFDSTGIPLIANNNGSINNNLMVSDNELPTKGSMLSGDFTISDDEYEDALNEDDKNDLNISDDEENVMNISDDEEEEDMKVMKSNITSSPASESYHSIIMNNTLSPPNAMKNISPPPSPPTISPSFYKQQVQQQQYFYRGKPPSSPHSSRINKSSMIPQAPLLPSGSTNHPPRPDRPERSSTDSNLKNVAQQQQLPPHHKQNASFDSSLLYAQPTQNAPLSSDTVAFAARKRTISAHSSDGTGLEGLLKAVDAQDKEMHERLKRKMKQVGAKEDISSDEECGVKEGGQQLGFAMERFLSSLGNNSGPESNSESSTPKKELVARAIAELQATESQIPSGEILVNMPDPRVPQMYNDILMPCGSDATSSLLSDLIPNEDHDVDEEIRLQETGDALIKEIEQSVMKERKARHDKEEDLEDDFDSLSDGSMFEDAINRKLQDNKDDYFLMNKDSDDDGSKTTPFSDGDKLYMPDNLTNDNNSEVDPLSVRGDRLLSNLSSVSSPGEITLIDKSLTLVDKGVVDSSGSLEISDSSLFGNTIITPVKSNTNHKMDFPPLIPKPPTLDNTNRASSLPSNLPPSGQTTNNPNKPPFKMPPSLASSNVFTSNNPPPAQKRTHRKMRSDVPTTGNTSKISNPIMTMMDNNNLNRNRTFSTGNIGNNRARTTSHGGDELRSNNWKNNFTKNLDDKAEVEPARSRAPSSTGIPPTITMKEDDVQQQQNRFIRPGKVPTKKIKHKQNTAVSQEPLVVDDFDYDKYDDTPQSAPIVPSSSYHSTTSSLFMENINKKEITPPFGMNTIEMNNVGMSNTTVGISNTTPMFQKEEIQTPHSLFPDPYKQEEEIPPPPPPLPSSQFNLQTPFMFNDPYFYQQRYPLNTPYYDPQHPQFPQQPPMYPPPPQSNFFMPPPPQNNPYYPMQHFHQNSLFQKDEEAALLQQPFFYPYGGIANNNPSNLTLNSIQQQQQQQNPNRSTIFSSVLTSISRTTSHENFETIESEKYVQMPCVKRAMPDRFLGLLFTLVLELPVWISMNNSEDLCVLVGRRKYMIFMAFLPLCCAISGNCGLQTSALTTRAIGFHHIQRSNYSSWVMTELFTTSLLGIGIGLFITLFAFQASGHDFSFASSIGLAQALSILLSSITGCISPIVLACIFSFGSSRHNDMQKWNGWLEIILQDLVGAFCMMVLGIWFLKWFGVDEIEIGDYCGASVDGF